jgi:hypothetical protein
MENTMKLAACRARSPDRAKGKKMFFSASPLSSFGILKYHSGPHTVHRGSTHLLTMVRHTPYVSVVQYYYY